MKHADDYPYRKQLLISVPLLTAVWWVAMWANRELPGEVLRGTSSRIDDLGALSANIAFLAVTASMITAYFGFLLKNRRRLERYLFAVLWPLFGVSTFAVFVTLLHGMSFDSGLVTLDFILEVLAVYGVLIPFLFAGSSWMSILPALAITMFTTERFANEVRRRKIEQFKNVGDAVPAS